MPYEKGTGMRKTTAWMAALSLAACGGGGAGGGTAGGGGAPNAAVEDAPPELQVQSPSGDSSGFVEVRFTPTDPDGDPVAVEVLYSADNGPWLPATAGPGSDDLSSVPSGTEVAFRWNSFADHVGESGDVSVRLRLSPSGGQAVDTAPVTVNNQSRTSGGSLAGFPIQTNPTTGGDSAERIAVDGRFMYVFGGQNRTYPNPDTSWRIEKRRLADGALDAAFGASGVLVTNPSTGEDRCEAIATDRESIYIAGFQFVASAQYLWRVEKRSAATGDLKWEITTGTLGDYSALTIAIDEDYVYVAGADFVSAPENYQMRIEKRRKTDGSLVDGFGAGGILLNDINAGGDGATGIALDSTHLYVAGIVNHGPSAVTRFEKRRLDTGALDGFGSIELDYGGDEMPESIVLDGSFFLVAVKAYAGGGVWNVVLDKRSLSDGSLAATQTISGTLTEECRPRLASDGSFLYVAYREGDWSASSWKIHERELSNLSIVWAQTSDPSPGSDHPNDLAAVGGVIYVVGEDHEAGSDGQWRIEARYR